MKSLTVVVFLTLLAACGGGGSGGGGNPESPTILSTQSPLEVPAPGPAGAMTDEDIEFKLLRKVDFDVKNGVRGVLSNLSEFTNHLNHRKIRVSVKNKNFSGHELRLECFEEDTKNVVSASFSELVAEIDGFQISSPLSVINPILNCSILSGEEKAFVKRVKIRRDILITKTQGLKDVGLIAGQKNEIDALVFSKDAILTTAGEKLLIDASLVIADLAKLQTFNKNEKATDGTKGLSGGNIKITTDVAVGELEVHMRGQASGANNSTDTTDYFGVETVRQAYAAQSNKICHVGGSMQTEINPKDMTGFSGGDSGQFYFKANEAHLDIDIESSAGAGGEGGYSRFAVKDRVIPAYFTFSEIKRYQKKIGWAFELMDEYHGANDFVACSLNRRTCVSTFGPNEVEAEPNYGAGKYHDRCKTGYMNKETLGTNFYFTNVGLSVPSGVLPTATRALTGSSGEVCKERITDNVYECI